jgi:hypothetical protein
MPSDRSSARHHAAAGSSASYGGRSSGRDSTAPRRHICRQASCAQMDATSSPSMGAFATDLAKPLPNTCGPKGRLRRSSRESIRHHALVTARYMSSSDCGQRRPSATRAAATLLRGASVPVVIGDLPSLISIPGSPRYLHPDRGCRASRAMPIPLSRYSESAPNVGCRCVGIGVRVPRIWRAHAVCEVPIALRRRWVGRRARGCRTPFK